MPQDLPNGIIFIKEMAELLHRVKTLAGCPLCSLCFPRYASEFKAHFV